MRGEELLQLVNSKVGHIVGQAHFKPNEGRWRSDRARYYQQGGY